MDRSCYTCLVESKFNTYMFKAAVVTASPQDHGAIFQASELAQAEHAMPTSVKDQ